MFERDKEGAVSVMSEPPAPEAGLLKSEVKQQDTTLQKVRNFRLEFGPSKKDILNFTNQLAVMIRAGISLQDCLESIAEQNEDRKSVV